MNKTDENIDYLISVRSLADFCGVKGREFEESLTDFEEYIKEQGIDLVYDRGTLEQLAQSRTRAISDYIKTMTFFQKRQRKIALNKTGRKRKRPLFTPIGS